MHSPRLSVGGAPLDEPTAAPSPTGAPSPRARRRGSPAELIPRQIRDIRYTYPQPPNASAPNWFRARESDLAAQSFLRPTRAAVQRALAPSAFERYTHLR